MPVAKTSRSASRMDQFPNFYRVALLTQVADTEQYTEWVTGYSIKDGYAFIIHKIKYRIAPLTRTLLNANNDQAIMGLVTNNTLTTPTLIAGISDSILDTCVLYHKEASSVGFRHDEIDIIHDFSNEPGGGRIIAPKPLYLAISSVGAGNVIGGDMEIVYTMVKLSAEVYRELYESMNPNA